MKTEIRTFHIRSGAEGAEDEQRLAQFLRSVEVKRMDTAYDSGWRVFVQYEDLRGKEETAQIAQALQQAVNGWRTAAARRSGRAASDLLTDAQMAEIARSAPTTEVELAALLGPEGRGVVAAHGAEIVQVTKRLLRDLTDPS
ncbi:MAG TPA: HRDC domain-containing protein [Alphaproteobacteria bacterium]|nr:HRDC domain-containing protein [Alphaproteobacteria bacterium]